MYYIFEPLRAIPAKQVVNLMIPLLANKKSSIEIILASNGRIVPIFWAEIALGRCVVVPEVTRDRRACWHWLPSGLRW